jgi:tetratricopeptide (TPR) repeat protein
MEKLNDDREDLLAATLAVTNTIDGDEHAEIAEAVAIEYAQRNEMEKAVEVMETVQDPYLRDKGIGSLAVIAVGAGDSQFADQLLNSVEDPSILTVAIEQMAVSHARRGDFETALQLCSELADTAQASGEIAITYAAKGFPEQAVELARSIESALPRTLAFVHIALEAIAQNNASSAKELLAEATESAAEIEFPEDQVDALVTIASVHERLGETDAAYEQLLEAIRVCDEIESTSGVITATSVRDHELALIASALANLKFFERADEVLETMEDPFRFALGSKELAMAYHKNQRQTEANELLDQAVEITEEAEVVSEQATALQQEVFSNLAYGYAATGQIEKALEVAELVHRVALKHHWLEEIGKVAVQLGADPSMISDSFADNASKSLFWLVVSDTYGGLNRPEESGEALKRAMKCAEDSSDRPYEQTLAFNEIATRLAKNGRLEQASQLFQRTLTTIPTIASSTRKALVLLDLSRKYSRLGRELNDPERSMLREILLRLEL